MIKVVYYYDKEKKHCPVKAYLASFDVSKIKDFRILTDIDRKIEHISNNNGRPDGTISKPLHNYSFFEIRKNKDSNTLIRICYFCHLDMMVLLHAFEKPNNYDTKRVRNKVDKEYKTSEKYKNKFIREPKLYENKK